MVSRVTYRKLVEVALLMKEAIDGISDDCFIDPEDWARDTRKKVEAL